jgi:hypothetical protein
MVSGHLHGRYVRCVDVEASDSSSVLSTFVCSLCWICQFLTSVKHEVLEGICLALLILVCSMFLEQYETV